MDSQYQLKTAVVKLTKIDPSKFLQHQSDSSSIFSGTDESSVDLKCSKNLKSAKRKISPSKRKSSNSIEDYVSQMNHLFEYDHEALIGTNALEYNMLRRQVEKQDYKYNLRKSSQRIDQDLEFKYDLFKSARQENVNYLLQKMKRSSKFSSELDVETKKLKESERLRSRKPRKLESSPRLDVKTKKLKESEKSRSKKPRKLEFSPSKKPKTEWKKMGKEVEEGLTDENDKVAHYNVIVTLQNDVELTIKYCQTFESGTVLINVVNHSLGKAENCSSSNKKEVYPKKNQSPRKKEKVASVIKFFYRYETIELPNGKLRGKLTISEHEFKNESFKKSQEVEVKRSSEINEETTNSINEAVPAAEKDQFPDKNENFEKNDLCLDEILPVVSSDPLLERNLPFVENDPFFNDLCAHLINQGEIDQGLSEKNLSPNFNKEIFEFDFNSDGFIETFSSTINNNNLNLPGLNVKVQKILSDLNGNDVVKKHEAMKLINRLLNYK